MLSVEKADIVGVGEACVEGKGGANFAGCGNKRLRLRSRKIDVELKSDDLKLKVKLCIKNAVEAIAKDCSEVDTDTTRAATAWRGRDYQ